MKHVYVFFVIITLFSCKNKNEIVDRSSEGLSHEDIISLEKNSLFTNETFIYEGVFEGNYYGDKVVLKLDDTKFTIDYKNKTYTGNLYKKEDVSLMQIDSKKKLPFQLFRWSDNTEIMILNEDGMTDESGENYLTRISKK